MLPSERGVSGVCVKLTMPAFILTLQCGVSGPNKGGHKKADVERKRGGEKTSRHSVSHLRSPHLLVACVCAVIMSLPLKLKTCRWRAHCGTH